MKKQPKIGLLLTSGFESVPNRLDNKGLYRSLKAKFIECDGKYLKTPATFPLQKAKIPCSL